MFILYLLFCLRRRQSPQAIFFVFVGGRRLYVETAFSCSKSTVARLLVVGP
jgi:hypothetical protein